MCYTPTISLTTAAIEFVLAIILLLFFKKSTLRNFFAALIFLIAFYQFTEFMVCTSVNPLLWAKAGIIAFSFLPALILHAFMRFVKKNPNPIFLYSIPVLASAAILIYPVVTAASCGTFFVEVQTTFNIEARTFLQNLSLLIYTSYYFGFLILAMAFFYHDYKKQRSKIKREIEIVELIGILLLSVPTLILLLIFPLLGLKFPSILCQFALFVAIAAFIGVYLESKIKKR